MTGYQKLKEKVERLQTELQAVVIDNDDLRNENNILRKQNNEQRDFILKMALGKVKITKGELEALAFLVKDTEWIKNNEEK